MFNIRGILNRRNDQSRSPESLLPSRQSSDDSSENNVDSAEGFLCPSCFVAFPTGEALQNHYEITHSKNLNGTDAEGKNTYVCTACKMKLGSEIELQSHYSRHHSEEKKETESNATELQLKAWEDIKLYLENELKTKCQEISQLKEEKHEFEQMAANLTKDLADLKLNLDELNSTNVCLKKKLELSEEKVTKLEVEIQQRPEQDDVIELKKGIKAAQEEMDKLALQKEAEKDKLEKQYNSLQETCSNLQQTISEMTKTIAILKEDLEHKENEKQKLQLQLEKFENYNEIKASLTEKQNSYDELLRQSKEKDFLLTKLKDELNKTKKEMEDIKHEKKRLVSEIANGKGVSEVMLQLKEENARLREQFITQQTLHLKATDESESKFNEMRFALEKSKNELLASNERCSELESELNQIEIKLKETIAQKHALSRDLDTQIANMTATKEVDKTRIKNLEEELNKLKQLYEEKNSALEQSLKELKLVKTSQTEVLESLQATKTKQEKYISDLAGQLTQAQNDIIKKEQSLTDLEKVHKELSDLLKEEKKQKSKLEVECKLFQRNYEEANKKLEELENIITENNAAKVEFCDKISALKEELCNRQTVECELNATIKNLNNTNSELKEKCLSLEEEIKNLKSFVTKLQNEKNSLLNELEEVQKTVIELNDLKVSHIKSIQELTDLNKKEKAHSEKLMKDFDLAKNIYLNDKLKMQKQIESLELDCAKQLSQVQETVKSLQNQLEEAEEKSENLNSSLENTKELLHQKEIEGEEIEARHTAQIGILTENIQTLREDLLSEQKKRENIEQELEDIRGLKLELEAKLENALEERSGLLKRCIKSEAECERLQKLLAEMRHKYEDCVAALQELGRENQTLQVENMKHITRKWADDSEVTHCTACGKLFTVTVRKHHCRNCGNIFCNECSAKTATVAFSKKPVRVCDVCYTEVTK